MPLPSTLAEPLSAAISVFLNLPSRILAIFPTSFMFLLYDKRSRMCKPPWVRNNSDISVSSWLAWAMVVISCTAAFAKATADSSSLPLASSTIATTVIPTCFNRLAMIGWLKYFVLAVLERSRNALKLFIQSSA